MKRAIIRMPHDVSDRVDRLTEHLGATHPGTRFSRAAVVRALLSKALEVVEAAGGCLDEAVDSVRRPGPPKSERRR